MHVKRKQINPKALDIKPQHKYPTSPTDNETEISKQNTSNLFQRPFITRDLLWLESPRSFRLGIKRRRI